MRFRTIAGLVLLVALSAAGACSSSSGGATVCTPGETRPCTGSGACVGGQACVADGSAWGACDCGGTKDAGSDTTPADTAEAGLSLCVSATCPGGRCCDGAPAYCVAGAEACPGTAHVAKGFSCFVSADCAIGIETCCAVIDRTNGVPTVASTLCSATACDRLLAADGTRAAAPSAPNAGDCGADAGVRCTDAKGRGWCSASCSSP